MAPQHKMNCKFVAQVAGLYGQSDEYGIRWIMDRLRRLGLNPYTSSMLFADEYRDTVEISATKSEFRKIVAVLRAEGRAAGVWIDDDPAIGRNHAWATFRSNRVAEVYPTIGGVPLQPTISEPPGWEKRMSVEEAIARERARGGVPDYPAPSYKDDLEARHRREEAEILAAQGSGRKKRRNPEGWYTRWVGQAMVSVHHDGGGAYSGSITTPDNDQSWSDIHAPAFLTRGSRHAADLDFTAQEMIDRIAKAAVSFALNPGENATAEEIDFAADLEPCVAFNAAGNDYAVSRSRPT